MGDKKKQKSFFVFYLFAFFGGIFLNKNFVGYDFLTAVILWAIVAVEMYCFYESNKSGLFHLLPITGLAIIGLFGGSRIFNLVIKFLRHY